MSRGKGRLAPIALALVVILVVALVLVSRPHPSPVTSTSSETYAYSGNPVTTTLALLDQRVSYGIASYDDSAVQQADLGMLVSTGAQCIRVDIGYGPWLSNDAATISLVGSVVSSIRSAGRCLIVADGASESYRDGGAIPWSKFKGAWVQRVSTIASLYHPYYYIVIKEPGWYVPLISDARTNPLFMNVTDWLGLTQNLTEAVLAASPATKVGIAIAADALNGADGQFYAEYLNQVQEIPGISFIGFDIYTPTGESATMNYLAQNPPSKSVWIPEAWSTPSPGNATSAQSDAQWMNNIYAFAKQIGAQFLIPFYTDEFASYNFDTNPADIAAAYSQTTPIYNAFSSLPEG